MPGSVPNIGEDCDDQAAGIFELTIKLADPYRGRKYYTASDPDGGWKYHPRIAKNKELPKP